MPSYSSAVRSFDTHREMAVCRMCTGEEIDCIFTANTFFSTLNHEFRS